MRTFGRVFSVSDSPNFLAADCLRTWRDYFLDIHPTLLDHHTTGQIFANPYLTLQCTIFTAKTRLWIDADTRLFSRCASDG